MSQDIAQQTKVETGMLKYLVEGLRATIAWKVQGGDFSRKLSTLRFIVRSFRTHLDRLFALEEFDGYMDLVRKKSPRLSRTVDELRQEHDSFRTEIRLIAHALERIVAADLSRFDTLCNELVDLLDKLDEHGRKEADLFLEAFEQVVAAVKRESPRQRTTKRPWEIRFVGPKSSLANGRIKLKGFFPV